jgi:hypothetical protein
MAVVTASGAFEPTSTATYTLSSPGLSTTTRGSTDTETAGTISSGGRLTP